MLKSRVHVVHVVHVVLFLLFLKSQDLFCALNVIKIIGKKIYSEKKATNRNTRSIRVLFPRWSVVWIIPGMAKYTYNPKYFSKVVYQVGCPFPGSSREWRGILRILSNFSKGVYQVGCPFLGSSREWRHILRILSNFSKGVYQVGCPFPGSPLEWRGQLLSYFSK